MHTTMKVLAGVALAAGLVGCSAAGGDSADSSAVDRGGEIAQSSGATTELADRDVTGDEIQRQVITTAEASVETDDPSGAADDLAELVAGLGGRVDDRYTWAGGSDDEEDPPRASITLRVPAEELDGVIEGLAELGTVLEVSSTSEDVTQQVVDLEARISALETSTDRLREIMAEASDSADLLEAEAALSERQSELESYMSQREHLGDQVAMSTLTVQLEPTGAAVTAGGGGFLGGLATGWNALLAFAGSLLVLAGTLTPWLLALGVPLLVILLVLRRRRRKTVAVAEA